MAVRFGSRVYGWLWWALLLGPLAATYLLDVPGWWRIAWCAIFVCLFLVWFVIFGLRHNRAVDGFADTFGWQVHDAGAPMVIDGARAPFDRPRPHRAVNAYSRAYGVHTVESYTLETGSKNRLMAHVVQIRLPGRHAWMQVRDDTVPDEVAAAAGGQDLAMESEAFNRRFRVRSDDPRHATDVLSPLMMAHLLDQPWPAAVHAWSIDGGALLWWRDGITQVDVIPEVAEFLAGIADRLPAYLLEP